MWFPEIGRKRVPRVGWLLFGRVPDCRNVHQELVAELSVVGIAVGRLDLPIVVGIPAAHVQLSAVQQVGHGIATNLLGARTPGGDGRVHIELPSQLLIEAAVLRQAPLAILQRKAAGPDAQKAVEEVAIRFRTGAAFNGSAHGSPGHVWGKKLLRQGLRGRF